MSEHKQFYLGSLLVKIHVQKSRINIGDGAQKTH